MISTQELIRGGVTALLSRHDDQVFVSPTVRYGMDVVIYDVIGLAAGDSSELERLVTSSKGVVALGRDLRPDLGTRAIARGAAVCISMSATVEELIAAVQAVHHGRAAYASPATAWLGQDAGLSVREADVIGLIAQGHSNKEIAERLYLSINSVKTYIRTGYRKLGLTRRSQAVAWAMRSGAPFEDLAAEA
ncbi:response regulator transcription factor [Nocardioides psychrotolerans]|uniref:helix-turn-helix transcriptional regulator n=1 Tax=Nocardioides psychrotolerans TaxID=1005945 RepID=UPI0031382662